MTQAINCPNCSRQIAIDDSAQLNELNQLRTQIEQIPKFPSHIPKYKCKNCDDWHENPNYKRPKGKCNNCNQFRPTKSGPCPYCKDGEIEEVSRDDLDDLGYPEDAE